VNIFFYAPQKTIEAKAAFDWLLDLAPPLGIKQLPSALPFRSPDALEMRSGDLIVLFACNREELEALLQLRLEFTNFRIVLILHKHDQELFKKGLLLNPKYFTSAEQNYRHIDETIRKIVS